MIEIQYLFGELLVNKQLIFSIEKGYEQEHYTLIINEKVIPFESSEKRDNAFKAFRKI